MGGRGLFGAAHCLKSAEIVYYKHQMKVLLVNPNRYQNPPVPPIGLEHVAACVEKRGHTVKLADLCFSDEPEKDLDSAVSAFRPDVVGITVRNVDTVLFHTNEFFLDEIRAIVQRVKSGCPCKVVIGGTGVLTNPDGVREYVNADYALVGPAEEGINDLLDEIAKNVDREKIRVSGYRFDISCPRKQDLVDYRKYFDHGGVAGFETHKGCSSSCIYCLEADTNISFKAVRDVVGEISDLVNAGFRRFHLCDPEFNEDLDYCVEFCTELKRAALDIEWSLYMKPANYNRKLIRLLKETGVSLITLTVDSWKKCPLYWSDIEKIIFASHTNGLKIMVDFLAGFPYEEEETLVWYLDMFRRVRPDGVGINTFIRLYKSLKITDIIMKDDSLKKNLLGHTEDADFIRPVFYNHVSTERLRELIGGDPLFRIEGLEKGVNYLRVNSER